MLAKSKNLTLSKYKAFLLLFVFSVATCTDFESSIPRCDQADYSKDELFSELWHIDSTGHSVADEDADANVIPAWEAGCLGKGIIVAVVDDGVDTEHPDLADKVIVNENSNYNSGDPDDPSALGNSGDPHGTSVAGIIGAAMDGDGVQGIAPLSQIMPIRLIADGEPSISNVISALYNAADNGAHIINNSWGPADNGTLFELSNEVYNALKDIGTNSRGGKGALITWAAGNGDEDVDYDGYAIHPNVMAIGAIGSDGKKSWYSDYGSEILVAAPSSGGGVDIWTTDVSGTPGYNGGVMPAGSYVAQVLGYAGETDTYTLQLGSGGSSQTEVENGEDEIAVSYPTSISGEIESETDIDYYAFTYDGSTDFELTLDISSGADLDIYLYNADGLAAFAGINGAGSDEVYVPNNSMPSGNYTADFGGTSAAAPAAAGVLALLLSYDNSLTSDEVRYLLSISSDKTVDDPSYPFFGGHSDAFGYGKIDAGELLRSAASDGKLDQFVQPKLTPSRRQMGSSIPFKYQRLSRSQDLVEADKLQSRYLRQAIQKGEAATLKIKGSKVYTDGTLLVRIKEANSFESAADRLLDLGFVVSVDEIRSGLLRVECNDLDLEKNMLRLKALPIVESVEPDLYFSLRRR